MKFFNENLKKDLKNMQNYVKNWIFHHNQSFSERRSFERRSERRSNFLSASWAPLTFWKVSAELSAAHNLNCERKLSAAYILLARFERRSERRSNFLSASWAPFTFWKLSAELSAAHILKMSAELSAAHFLVSALMLWI